MRPFSWKKRAERAEAALLDLAEHGLRCDLTPTMPLRDAPDTYMAMVRYLRRSDDYVRARARRGLGEAA